MRQIGTISDGAQAERFADFLRGQGASCSLDAGDDGWVVWIHDEDRVAAAKEELQAFLADPQQERYREARRQAEEKLREDFARKKASRRQTVSLRSRWERPLVERSPLTIGLLVVCAVVAFFTRLGGSLSSRARRLSIFCRWNGNCGFRRTEPGGRSCPARSGGSGRRCFCTSAGCISCSTG